MVDPRLDAADVDPCERGLRALGCLRRWRLVKRLSGGGSGSQVFLLELEGQRVVLKVTENGSWHERALHELAFYGEFGATLSAFLPAVRAAQHDPGCVRLLLDAYEPYPSALEVTDDAWVELATQLGHLQHLPTPRPTWLKQRPWPTPEAVADAVRLLAGRGLAALASRAASKLAAARDLESVMDTVLTHGDCHVGNLLYDPDGKPLWVDWQQVCLSTGLDDLVFLWQRAEFEGAHPPRDAMTSAYAAARSVVPDRDFYAAVDKCELRLLLVSWPSYLAMGGQDRQQVMRLRLQQLVNDDRDR